MTTITESAGRPIRRGPYPEFTWAGVLVGYVIWHRFQVGPGMSAVAVTAATAGPTPQPAPSLVPTCTPVPPPTATAEPPAAGAPPTPIPEPALPIATAIARPPAQAPPTRLVIAKLDLDIPVVPVTIKTIGDGDDSRLVWGDRPNEGGFHYTSAYPGNPGNTVINGHRDIQGAVFRHLDRLAVGDEIVLYVGEVAYPYVVAQTLVVAETFASAGQRAENLKLISYLPEERLTLVTCTPVGLATHRLLVIAKPPEQPPQPAASP